MASIALARVYQQSFEAHPYTTLALTNGALNALGDTVAQLTQNFVRARPSHVRLPCAPLTRPLSQIGPRDNHLDEPPRYDYNRTARFFAFGLGMGELRFDIDAVRTPILTTCTGRPTHRTLESPPREAFSAESTSPMARPPDGQGEPEGAWKACSGRSTCDVRLHVLFSTVKINGINVQ